MTNQVESNATINTNVATITPETLPVLTWNNQPVITTEFLAAVYGAKEKQIRQNFNNNRDRFVEGVHFFKIEGDDFEEFKLHVDNIDAQISNMTRSLTLWTERGTIRHAKILETDQAWQVQERLEDCYFTKSAAQKPERAKEALPPPNLVKFIAEKGTKWYIEMDENLNPSFRRLLPSETVQSKEALVKEMRGEGFYFMPNLECYRYRMLSNDVRESFKEMHQILADARYPLYNRVENGNTVIAKHLSTASQNLWNVEGKINDMLREIDAGINKVMDGVDILIGYQGLIDKETFSK
jgi:hypothetical protein